MDHVNRYTILLGKGDEWEPSAKNFKVKRVRYKQFSFNPLDQITFPLVLYALRPNLVHFSMTQQPLFYFGNIITTTHDLAMLKYTHRKTNPQWLHFFKDIGYRFLMWTGHHKSKRIIVPTYSVKKQLVRHHGFSLPKIDVTLESGELPKINQPKQPEFLKTNDEFICYVGTAFPHKNGELMVQAYEKLAQKHPDLKLLFVGRKEFFYEKLEDYTRKRGRSTDNIIFTDFVSDEELVWIYKHAKAYVFPTLAEGFGLPGLEAMSHGLPVAASNLDVLKEVYEDAVIYFDPEDPYDIARVVDKLLTDKHLQAKLREKGYQQIKKYSWQRMAEQTLEIYEKALI